MPGGQVFQLDAPDTGDGIVFDDQLVSVGRGSADIGLGVELIPGPQPGGHGVVLRADYIDALDLLQCRLELFLDLRLGFGKYISDDSLSGLGVIASGLAPLPPAVLPLADIPFAAGPFLCHDDRLLCSNTTYELDVMIFSAAEVDTNFDVNVLTASNGVIIGALGGHPDTAAGAKLAVDERQAEKLYTGAMKDHTMYVIHYLEIERKHGVRSNLAAACLAQVSLP